MKLQVKGQKEVYPFKMAEKTVCILQQQRKPIKIIKWKVSEGNLVSIGSDLLLYDFDSQTKKEQRKLKSSQAGTVHKILAQEGAIIKPGEVLCELTECSHPTIMNDMCAECGADLRKDDLTSSASVPMVHSIPDLKVSEELAIKLGKADRERLLKERKLVLLVDLDQTLIHTTNDNIPPNIKDVYHFQLYGPNSPWYHTRLRPGTHEFLENIWPYFELHICTFGARNYAHTIAMFLDEDQRLFSNRILSRDECFDPTSKKANLKALFPCGDNLVCIIDDREDVWSHATNLIHVKPYHFFQHTGDINAPPGLDKHEDDDKKGVDLSKVKSQDTHNNDKNSENMIEKDAKNGQKTVIQNNSSDTNASNSSEVNNKQVTQNGEVSALSANDIQKDTVEKSKPEKPTQENTNEKSKPETPIQEDTIEKSKPETPIQEDTIEKSKPETPIQEDTIEKSKPETPIQEDTIEKSKPEKPMQENTIEKSKPEKPQNTAQEVQDTQESENIDKEEKQSKSENIDKEDKPLESESKTICNEEQKPEEVVSNTQEQKHKKNLDRKEDGLIEIEDPDDYLLYLEEILKRIHDQFYDEYDKLESGEVPDLKKVIPAVRAQVLKGTKLVFSGLVPTHIRLEQSKAYQVARSLGAEVTQDLEDGTTHLVAVRPGTAKVNAGRRRKNLKIVTPDWLWCCAERWEHVNEQIYNLSSKGSKNRHPPPHCSSPEHITNYPEHENPVMRKRTPSGRFMDTINPLMSFSSADIASMDKEVEDILEDSESSEDEVAEAAKIETDAILNIRADNDSSSSSDDSLTGEHRGHKRRRSEVDDEDRCEDANNTEDDMPSVKFRRGENVDSELDLDPENSQASTSSFEARDESDDGEWNMMGAALEREFLSNE